MAIGAAYWRKLFRSAVERMEAKPSYNAISSRTLEDALNQIDESFSEMLLRKIEQIRHDRHAVLQESKY